MRYSRSLELHTRKRLGWTLMDMCCHASSGMVGGPTRGNKAVGRPQCDNVQQMHTIGSRIQKRNRIESDFIEGC
jgi:hypothetical protein